MVIKEQISTNYPINKLKQNIEDITSKRFTLEALARILLKCMQDREKLHKCDTEILTRIILEEIIRLKDNVREVNILLKI